MRIPERVTIWTERWPSLVQEAHVMTTTAVIKYNRAITTVADLGIWTRLYDCSWHQFTASQCVLKCAHFTVCVYLQSTGWNLKGDEWSFWSSGFEVKAKLVVRDKVLLSVPPPARVPFSYVWTSNPSLSVLALFSRIVFSSIHPSPPPSQSDPDTITITASCMLTAVDGHLVCLMQGLNG